MSLHHGPPVDSVAPGVTSLLFWQSCGQPCMFYKLQYPLAVSTFGCGLCPGGAGYQHPLQDASWGSEVLWTRAEGSPHRSISPARCCRAALEPGDARRMAVYLFPLLGAGNRLPRHAVA